MRKRTLGREFAMQILYQADITRQGCETSMDNFWEMHKEDNLDGEVKDFAAELVRGVSSNLEKIDATLAQFATNWQLGRMAVVDRNILRIGCFELLFRDDIPPKVAINEAVEIAKKFSGIEAGKFVNGVLDKINIEEKK